MLRVGLTPFEIAALTLSDFAEQVAAARRGRRVWRFKVAQVHTYAHSTGAVPHGAAPMMREIGRVVARVHLLSRVRAHDDRLRQRDARPLETMPAMVACMNKWLLYAFAVMKRREAFQVDHVWRSQALATAS